MSDDQPQMPDLGGLLDSFQRVQAAREALYEGRAGGGAVVIRASGDLQFEDVTISADVVDPSDVEMLQDLVLAALHDLAETMADAQHEAMGALGGLDIGGLLSGGAVPGELPGSAALPPGPPDEG
jgi:DNA-binding protein YbaB